MMSWTLFEWNQRKKSQKNRGKSLKTFNSKRKKKSSFLSFVFLSSFASSTVFFFFLLFPSLIFAKWRQLTRHSIEFDCTMFAFFFFFSLIFSLTVSNAMKWKEISNQMATLISFHFIWKQKTNGFRLMQCLTFLHF